MVKQIRQAIAAEYANTLGLVVYKNGEIVLKITLFIYNKSYFALAFKGIVLFGGEKIPQSGC